MQPMDAHMNESRRDRAARLGEVVTATDPLTDDQIRVEALRIAADIYGNDSPEFVVAAARELAKFLDNG